MLAMRHTISWFLRTTKMNKVDRIPASLYSLATERKLNKPKRHILVKEKGRVQGRIHQAPGQRWRAQIKLCKAAKILFAGVRSKLLKEFKH